MGGNPRLCGIRSSEKAEEVNHKDESPHPQLRSVSRMCAQAVTEGDRGTKGGRSAKMVNCTDFHIACIHSAAFSLSHLRGQRPPGGRLGLGVPRYSADGSATAGSVNDVAASVNRKSCSESQILQRTANPSLNDIPQRRNIPDSLRSVSPMCSQTKPSSGRKVARLVRDGRRPRYEGFQIGKLVNCTDL